MDHHEAARAEPGQRALDRERGQDRGDCGIDGVAARTEDAGARLGGQWMARGDDPAHAAQGRAEPGRTALFPHAEAPGPRYTEGPAPRSDQLSARKVIPSSTTGFPGVEPKDFAAEIEAFEAAVAPRR